MFLQNIGHNDTSMSVIGIAALQDKSACFGTSTIG
jgi:hypothetical protein